MEPCTKVSGTPRLTREMVVVSKFGPMAHVMTDFGKMALPVAMVAWFMLRVMSMRAPGKTIKLTVLDTIATIMVVVMKDSG